MELQHHGVKGMRWGVRRFQKKDGTLTPSGKKRYDSPNDKSSATDRKELERIVRSKLGSNPSKRDPSKVAQAIGKDARDRFEAARKASVKDNQSSEMRRITRAAYVEELNKIAPLVGGKVDKRGLISEKNSRQVHKLIDEISRMSDKYSKKEYYPEQEHPGYGTELRHHGIKGQKWGVRRFRNEDGTLTAAGRKRVSKEYRMAISGVNKEFSKQQSKMYVNAHNKAAEKYNTEFTKKYNEDWERKHGKDSFGSDEYTKTYMEGFNKEIVKNYNQSLAQFYKSSPSYNKAKSLVDSYGMKDWDSFAKQNEDAVDEIRRTVERYSR